MKTKHALLAMLATLGAWCWAAPAGTVAAAGFQDPLALPAQASAFAHRSLLQGAARAGTRLVAVGQRGHIVHSDDDGASWKQASVPVSSDLTAVRFVNENRGWAVGHDGVVLHSADGGRNWTLQLDGRRANQLVVDHLQERVRANPQQPQLKGLLDEARRNVELGADKPLLDLWFADERTGYVVGAYNLIFRTTDGGATWEPWFDRTDNPKLLNLYAIAAAGGELYVAGESGLVLKLDATAQRFVARPTPYKGGLFGLVGTQTGVIAFGLRGTAFGSDDGGLSWRKLDVGLPATIVAGVSLPDGAVILADASGRLAASGDAGRSFKPLATKQAMPLAGIADAGRGRLVLVGLRGVALTDLPAR